MSKTRTKTGGGTLIDEVRENAVDKYLLRFRRRVLLLLLILVIAVVALCYWRCKRCATHAGAAPSYGSLVGTQVEEGAAA